MRHPLTKLPEKTDIVLFLIREELKARKLFYILQEAGMTDCDFEPHLDSLILQFIGIDDDNDAVFEKYCVIMEKRSKKIESDSNTIMKHVFKAYHEILNIKEGQTSKKN